MSVVSVIGLGAMGSAIAKAFLNAGRATTVWNRSAEKAQPVLAAGAIGVTTPNEAVTASPVTVVCIDDYAATWNLFEQYNLGATFAGKTLIQFSTGTPEEARQSEEGARIHGCDYLDGAILAYPREMGHDGLVTISGATAVYAQTEALLGALSSDIRYLGDAIGGAAALDIAVMTYYCVTHLGFTHAALICESEDVRPDLLAGVLVDSLPSDTEEIAHLGQALLLDKFDDPGASISVYSNILDRILAQAKNRSLDDRIPAFANRVYKEGVAAGFGDEEVVALIKLLRR